MVVQRDRSMINQSCTMLEDGECAGENIEQGKGDQEYWGEGLQLKM